jgi:hypothetical protein
MSKERRDCPICDGSGVCQSCNGKGHTPEWLLLGLATNDCKPCDRSGHCPRCQGKGHIPKKD